MHRIRQRVSTVIAGVIAFQVCSTTVPALADAWPWRPVHILVPFAAGFDAPLRAYANVLTKRWKQPIIIENRPGAEGIIAVDAFVRTHDDHALLWHSAAPISTFPLLHERLSFSSQDLVPISSTDQSYIAISAPLSLNIRSLTDFVSLAHKEAGKLNYYPMNGGSFTILLLGFAKTEKLDIVEVNYRDSGRGMQDLSAGLIHLMMTTLSTTLPLVQAGKIRVLAVTNPDRAPIAPDIPTVREAGYPELEFSGLRGLFGAKDMPVARREQIAADIRAAAADPDVIKLLAPFGVIPKAGTPDHFAAAIERQRSQMVMLARLAGIRPNQ